MDKKLEFIVIVGAFFSALTAILGILTKIFVYFDYHKLSIIGLTLSYITALIAIVILIYGIYICIRSL